MINLITPDLTGKNIVILGSSMIVGTPLAFLLRDLNASVTLFNVNTKNADLLTKMADILVVAIGKAKLVKEYMVKRGAIVIDVGINKLISEKMQTIIVGDIDFDKVTFIYVIKVANFVSPVPGGVGPITAAMLLENVYLAWKFQNNIPD